MIIIVEGIDRVGKTTLCEKLRKSLGFKIYKREPSDFEFSKMDNMNETDKILQILKICELSECNIIFDRLHLTDYVYGIIERSYDVEKASKNIEWIENKLLTLDTELIIIEPTDIVRSSKEHGKDLSQYAKLFDICFEESNLNKIKCNYNSINIVEKMMKGKFNEYMHK
jgi:hypothetical protein